MTYAELLAGVYDILIKEVGASAAAKDGFIAHHDARRNETSEWRFVGSLGFGGKLYTRPNYAPKLRFRVDYHPSEHTPKREAATQKAQAAVSDFVEANWASVVE